MGKSMKSSKVVPTAGQDGDSAGGIAGRSLERMYKVVEHLSDCVAWRSGVCAFPDCIEVAQLLHHRAKCRANQGTPAERLTEIYKQNDPPARSYTILGQHAKKWLAHIYYYRAPGTLFHQIRAKPRHVAPKLFEM